MAKTSTLFKTEFIVNPEELISFTEGEHVQQPSQHIIDSLLRYSKSLEIKKSAFVGNIETTGN